MSNDKQKYEGYTKLQYLWWLLKFKHGPHPGKAVPREDVSALSYEDGIPTIDLNKVFPDGLGAEDYKEIFKRMGEIDHP